MQILIDDDGKTVALVLKKSEGRDLHDALMCAVEPEHVKPPRKNSKTWKIAHKITEEIPVW